MPCSDFKGRASRPLISILACALMMAVTQAHAGASVLPADSDAARRTGAQIAVPELHMVRQDGTPVRLDQELNDGRPVVVNFVYTSCTTICPMTSLEFESLQKRLGKDRQRVHLVSISIDPEQDTPARLRSYAQQFHAGKEWDYYTSDAATSVKAQMAFGVYRGDKMSHVPVTLLRTAPGNQWVRLDGFATAEQVYAELQGLRASR
jgi:protein SCO1/2